jgi:hemoglobin
MSQEDQYLKSDVATVYERVGGDEFFGELVERFYKLVEDDPVLRPLYPQDLNPGKSHLAAFLAQLWGGPPRYILERGHPRLRQRHFQFPIGQTERDAWVAHMTSALGSMDVPVEDGAVMRDYFANTATLMMNR